MNIFDIEFIWLFLGLLPIVAFTYSSVGHGGASGYLALMAIFGFAPELMKPNALLLNLFVSAIAFYHFKKEGHFKGSLFFPFALGSIPAAFIGGFMNVNPRLYKIILGILLIIAILRILFQLKDNPHVNHPLKTWVGLTTGAGIGFFSGLIGIGGGIILTPIILIMNWGNLKTAAAVSALFIWVNSMAGLSGQLISGVKIDIQAFILVFIAIIGGYFGAYYGSKKFDISILKYLLAFVLSIAALKLFFV